MRYLEQLGATPNEGVGLVETPGAAGFRVLSGIIRQVTQVVEDVGSYETTGEIDKTTGLYVPADPDDLNYRFKKSLLSLQSDEMKEALKEVKDHSGRSIAESAWAEALLEEEEAEGLGWLDMLGRISPVGFSARADQARYYEALEKDPDLMAEHFRAQMVRGASRAGRTQGTFWDNLVDSIETSEFVGDDLAQSYTTRLRGAAIGDTAQTTKQKAMITGIGLELSAGFYTGGFGSWLGVYRGLRGAGLTDDIVRAAKSRRTSQVVEAVLNSGPGRNAEDLASAMSYEDDAAVFMGRQAAPDYVEDFTKRQEEIAAGGMPSDYQGETPRVALIKDLDGFTQGAQDEIRKIMDGGEVLPDSFLHKQIIARALRYADDSLQDEALEASARAANIQPARLKDLEAGASLESLEYQRRMAGLAREALSDPQNAEKVLNDVVGNRLGLEFGRLPGLRNGWTMVSENVAVSNTWKQRNLALLMDDLDGTIKNAMEGAEEVKGQARLKLARLVAQRDPEMAIKIVKEGPESIREADSLYTYAREGAVRDATGNGGKYIDFEGGWYNRQYEGARVQGDMQAIGWRNLDDIIKLGSSDPALWAAAEKKTS